MDDDGNRLEHPLQSFWETPNGYDTEKLAQQREAVFNMLISHFNYTFGFFVAYEHPIGPELEKMENGVYAITFTNSLHMQFDNHIPDKKPRVFTFLGTAFPEMLFRTDLNSTERMQIEWHIANTVSATKPIKLASLNLVSSLSTKLCTQSDSFTQTLPKSIPTWNHTLRTSRLQS